MMKISVFGIGFIEEHIIECESINDLRRASGIVGKRMLEVRSSMLDESLDCILSMELFCGGLKMIGKRRINGGDYYGRAQGLADALVVGFLRKVDRLNRKVVRVIN